MNILIIPSWYNSKEKPLNGIFFKEQAMALKNYFQKKNTNDKVFILYLERFSILDLKILKLKLVLRITFQLLEQVF